MSENANRETLKICPYCGDRFGHLPPHLRACDAVPTTEEVVGK
jgi:hypothetical protein